MQNMPPEVAARQAGRVTAAPPAPSTWLVAVGGGDDGGSGSGSGGSGASAAAAFLDPTPRGGALLDARAARERYPHLDAALAFGSSEKGGTPAAAAAAGGACVASVWAELARTLVMAHQRRGESDLVAHWLYQALALDAAAPEWGHALGG